MPTSTRAARGQPAKLIPNFITVIDMGLDNCAPDNSPQHDALALLMGKPVPGAGGDPARTERRTAVNQGAFGRPRQVWNRQKPNRNKPVAADAYHRTTNALEQVQIPCA
ncbi:MAG: hypothetical protein H6566_06080 [Lewinellaceae bacterium]|nr:hypothetical protein [Lewinellaceae bacterium]